MKKHILLLSLFSLLLLAACSKSGDQAQTVSEDYEYPEEYEQKGIPKYPGSMVKERKRPSAEELGVDSVITTTGEAYTPGREEVVRKLGQGVENFDFFTKDKVQDINAFYQDKLSSEGWVRLQLNRGDGPTGNDALMHMYERGHERLTMMIRPKQQGGLNKVQFVFQDKTVTQGE